MARTRAQSGVAYRADVAWILVRVGLIGPDRRVVRTATRRLVGMSIFQLPLQRRPNAGQVMVAVPHRVVFEHELTRDRRPVVQRRRRGVVELPVR